VKEEDNGETLKCSRCRKSPAPFAVFSKLLNIELHHCKECYIHDHEKIECEKCGRKVIRKELLLHKSYHTEL
jgi:hypothetical protein